MNSGQRDRFRGVPLGQQLGFLEYLVTPESLDSYRKAVDYGEAAYPNIVAGECLAITVQKMKIGAFDSVTHCDRYFRPPEPGRRVQVTGWLREKGQRRGVEQALVETFAVDEIGTEILRSSHVFQSAASSAPGRLGRRPSTSRTPEGAELLPPVTKQLSEDTIARFESANRALLGPAGSEWRGPSGNLHTGAELASGMGLSGAVAPGELGLAYLHELLDRRFGIDFRQGGMLEISYRRPFYVGDTVTAQGIARVGREEGDRKVWQVQVWLENGRGEQVITGNAQVTAPSPLT